MTDHTSLVYPGHRATVNSNVGAYAPIKIRFPLFLSKYLCFPVTLCVQVSPVMKALIENNCIEIKIIIIIIVHVCRNYNFNICSFSVFSSIRKNLQGCVLNLFEMTREN